MLAAAAQGSGRGAELSALVVLGDAAKERLVVCNLRLVMSIAWRYAGHGVALMDLVQAGNLGLIRAVEKFDWRRGHRFSTYATWWIRQSVSRVIADDRRVVRLPVHVVEQVRRLEHVRADLMRQQGDVPTVEQVAVAAGQDAARVEELLRLGRAVLSWHELLEAVEELPEVLVDPHLADPADAVCDSTLGDALDRLLSVLPPRDAWVLRRRHGIGGGGPRTLEEIGRELGLTRERIRQIESKALERLRTPSRLALLEGYDAASQRVDEVSADATAA